ncbi:hypothetical protein PV10_02492 [Exophiala mesophila]|uniref:Uncharacterized protein n=1 Tax=Exophiala mesophila TaxID=212818 RepID=A0A0D1WZ31_EXOME|nr:uncharacterized protein PV10_02492 [Exophiala mesophila]KIV94760.1 hypothetical protein PV10_02492 [Exophiala mesophila]
MANPGLTACAVTGAIGATIIAFPALDTLPLLALGGFGAGGVQAGSPAAAVQAGIGNVAAGSWFAIAQSAAMGGSGIAIANAAVEVGAVVVAAGGALGRGVLGSS